MEVTKIEENTDTLVIGGQRARQFHMSTSAEFITVLSDSLYSNKELAALREVMTNAWDAHIAAGITDTPIEVIINQHEVIIRDFGKGIPDDMMQDIYCTYGESTKREDGAQTGGFGLGSKAPFAVTNTFSVTSCHAGVKTVYSVSKGTEETDGLPALIPIMSAPTDETGISVMIPMEQSPASISEIVIKLAKFGSMLTKINFLGNEKIIDKFLFSGAETNIVFYNEAPSYTSQHGEELYIKYGSVVYPLDVKDEYTHEYGKVVKLLRKVRISSTFYTNYSTLIIEAPADSINLAPSREHLSYTKFCIANIKDLLAKAYTTITRYAEEEYIQDYIKRIAGRLSAFKFTNTIDVVDASSDLSNVSFSDVSLAKAVVNTDFDFRHTFGKVHYMTMSRGISTRRNLLNGMLEKAIHDAGHTGVIRYWNIFKSKPKYDRKPGKPTLRVSKHQPFDHKYMNPNAIEFKKYFYRRLGREFGWDLLKKLQTIKFGYNVKIDKDDLRYVNSNFSFVIANNRTQIRHLNDDRDLERKETHRVHDYANHYLMTLPKNQKEYDVDSLISFIRALGINVVDGRAYEPSVIAATQRKKAASSSGSAASSQAGRKKAGYALLSESVDGRYFHQKNFANANRIGDPEAYVVLETNMGSKTLPDMVMNNLDIITKYVPKTVLVSSNSVRDNLRAKLDIKDVQYKLVEVIGEFFLKNPDALSEACAYDFLKSGGYYGRICNEFPDAAKRLGYTKDQLSGNAAEYSRMVEFHNRFVSVSEELYSNAAYGPPDISMFVPEYDTFKKNSDKLELFKMDYYFLQSRQYDSLNIKDLHNDLIVQIMSM